MVATFDSYMSKFAPYSEFSRPLYIPASPLHPSIFFFPFFPRRIAKSSYNFCTHSIAYSQKQIRSSNRVTNIKHQHQIPCNKFAHFSKSRITFQNNKNMASSSLAFSSAVSSEIATSSTYRRAMSKQASRHLYNYRLNTPEPQQSHHRKSTRTHQTAFTQNHRASRQLTTAITPPRRHPGVSLPEASASQHQAMYLEYLDLVAAGKITDPASPPDYQNYGGRDDEEEVPEFAPPSYEQVLGENGVYEDGRRGRDEETRRRRRRRRGVVFRPTQPTRTRPATQTPTPAPAIQELQLIRITTPIPTTLPLRPKSVNSFSRLGDKFRVSRAG